MSALAVFGKTFTTLTATLIFTGGANGALITGLTIQSATIGGNPNMSPSDAIDGTGLSGGVPALSGTHSTTWSTHWWGSTKTPQITIDLEGAYSLDMIQIWSHNESGNGPSRGLQEVAIYVAADENEANLIKLITDTTGSHDNASGDFILPKATGLTDYTGFSLDLSGVTNSAVISNARLVRIQALNTYGDNHGGLAEVQFSGTAIPEPSMGFMLTLTGLGLALRRCRK
jgi:hypothetical protein